MGPLEGDADGTPVGALDGLEDIVGAWEGRVVGEGVPTTGACVGDLVGLLVGRGDILGDSDGCQDGRAVGDADGRADNDGATEGAIEEDGTAKKN